MIQQTNALRSTTSSSGLIAAAVTIPGPASLGAQPMVGPVLDVGEDLSIRRHQIPNRLTSVERRLMRYFSDHRTLITCVGNIGVGKSSLIKLLAYGTGMNALFELPDEGFEDHFVRNDSFHPLLTTVKHTVKRTLGRYYGTINDFIDCQARHPTESPAWMMAKRSLEGAALDIQHAYLDLRKMQLQTVSMLENSSCVDGSFLADRYAFCEVLHRDMDVSYLTRDAVATIDQRLASEFSPLVQPGLIILLHGPLPTLYENILERDREEERRAHSGEIPEGLGRLVRALNSRYAAFVDTVRSTGWYTGPILRIDVSKIDFISNVRHLIGVYEGIERLLAPPVRS